MSACSITGGAFCRTHWSRLDDPRATTCVEVRLSREVDRLRKGIEDMQRRYASDPHDVLCEYVAEELYDLLNAEVIEDVRADAKAEVLDGLSGRLWALLQREDHDDWCHAGWGCGCGCSCSLPGRLARGLGA